MTEPLAPTTIGERQAIAEESHALRDALDKIGYTKVFRAIGDAVKWREHRALEISVERLIFALTGIDQDNARYLTKIRSGETATPTTNAPVADRANDKPPAHWTPDDKCERHPQTAEEWDWHADNPNGPSRSLKRLSYAADRADPHAPDQMALVLRIDIMRLEGDYIHQKARADSLKRRLDALAIDAPQTLPIHGEMREALEGFINDLTDHGRNRANCLSIDHDALNARILAARNALQGDGL